MRIWCVVALCVVAGCKTGGDDDVVRDAAVADAAPTGMGMIGPGGGSVTSTDGVLTLTVPAGAVSATTAFTVDVLGAGEVPAAVSAFQPFSPVYRVEPSGTVFAQPVTLSWHLPAGQSRRAADGAQSFLFGHSHSAGTIENYPTTTTVDPDGAGTIRVDYAVTHLSEQFLMVQARQGNTPVGPPIAGGKCIAEYQGGLRAVGTTWRADAEPRFESDDVYPLVWLRNSPTADAPVSPANSGTDVFRGLSRGQVVNFFVPQWKCDAAGLGKAKLEFKLESYVSPVVPPANDAGPDQYKLEGKVVFEKGVTCLTREEKAEYIAQSQLLGTPRIEELTAGQQRTIDLAQHGGQFGFHIVLEAGATLQTCVSANRPTDLNYFPRFPPGFNFTDVPPAGCTNTMGVDPLNPNEYLLVASSTATPLPMITVRALTPP